MKSLLTLVKIEFKLSLREFSGVLFGMMLPVGIVLLMGALYGSQPAYEGAPYTMMQQAVAAVMAVGICSSGLMGVPITLSNYREKKILKRFQVSPSTPKLLIGAQFINNFIFATLSSIAVWLVAKLFFGYEMLGSSGLFMVVYLSVLFSIFAIGAMIASIAKTEKIANLLCTLAYFPMFFLSGATVPYEIMPDFLRRISDVMPLSLGIKLLKEASLDQWTLASWNGVFILILTGILGMIVSALTFKYDYE